MAEAAERAGVATATTFELRWLPDRARIRELVRDGVIGKPYFVRLSQSGSYWHPSRKLQALWMYDIEQGGGYLNGLLAHDIDFVCALFGRPVAVCAEVRTAVPTRPLPDGDTLEVSADDTSALLLRLDSGALAVITASVVGVHAAGARLDVFGEHGTIVGPLGTRHGLEPLQAGTVEDEGLRDIEPDHRTPRYDELISDRGASGLIRAMSLMLEDWLPAVMGGTAVNPIPTFTDGMIVQQVIEAAPRLPPAPAGSRWVERISARWLSLGRDERRYSVRRRGRRGMTPHAARASR